MNISERTIDILTDHIDSSYYDSADNKDVLSNFWGDGVYYDSFLELDLSNVIEFAAGRGRHVPYYKNLATKITLVDGLSDNIDHCIKKYGVNSNVSYLANDGRTLKELDSATFTSIFSYDAIVHFEMVDVWGYLNEMYRVLTPGGKALLHHSNYYNQPMNNWKQNPHNRNFMSDIIFSHLANRAGFKVIRQTLIDWGEHQKLDCLTMLCK